MKQVSDRNKSQLPEVVYQIQNLKVIAKYSKESQEEVKEALHEMKEGKLKIGNSDQKVTNPQQAIAIGLSEAKAKGEKVPKPQKTIVKKK